jgi:3-phosphoshikimate 1-carboxyvinyltransferase
MSPYPAQLELSAVMSVLATVHLPGSKSITNRAYLLAALAEGSSKIENPLFSEDTEAMTSCLSSFGISIDSDRPTETVVHGRGGELLEPTSPLFVGNSGTTIRFLTAASALAPQHAKVVLDGIPRMRERPIADLIEALQQLGIVASATRGCPPVTVHGGGFPGGRSLVKGSISSQYLSAILMCAPYAKSDVTLLVDGELVSKPYVQMTISMMKSFGVDVFPETHSYFIPSGQKYFAQLYSVEPDASNASYFLAAAAVTAGTVRVEGLGSSSIQGDIAFIDVLEKMGCKIEKTADSLTVTGSKELAGIEFDASEIPDMAQTIAVVAAFARSPTKLTGLRTLRVKETDRISALANELTKIGSVVTEGDDFLVISPATCPTRADINTYHDHRMAMSFAVAGLKIKGLRINDPGCVAKTFPDFWKRWSTAFPGAIKEVTNDCRF